MSRETMPAAWQRQNSEPAPHNTIDFHRISNARFGRDANHRHSTLNHPHRRCTQSHRVHGANADAYSISTAKCTLKLCVACMAVRMRRVPIVPVPLRKPRHCRHHGLLTSSKLLQLRAISVALTQPQLRQAVSIIGWPNHVQSPAPTAKGAAIQHARMQRSSWTPWRAQARMSRLP